MRCRRTGALWLNLATELGAVTLTVELHDGPPAPASNSKEKEEDEREDVVEVSFRAGQRTVLETGEGDSWAELALTPGDHRLRISVAGLDLAREQPIRAPVRGALARGGSGADPGPVHPGTGYRQPVTGEGTRAPGETLPTVSAQAQAAIAP